jgi:hypothetical protein
MLMASAVLGASEFSTYVNGRYGYSISYPARLLRPLPESESGDGRAFAAKNGKGEFLVYAGGAVEGIDATSQDIIKSEEGRWVDQRASYRVVKSKLAAISCSTGTEIFYRKTLLQGGLNTTFTAAYPLEDRAVWDPVVATMAASLKAGRFLD